MSNTISTSFSGIVYSGTTAQSDYILQVVEDAGGVVATGASTFNTSAGINSFPIDPQETMAVNNTAYGYGALENNESGDSNVAVGVGALNANNNGSQNIAIGTNALDANTSGTNNVAMGGNALGGNTTGNNSIAIGADALLVNNGDQNIAIGAFALDGNTSGTNNVAMGRNALGGNTTGNNSIAIGADALLVNNGNLNIAIGSNALSSNTTGINSIAIGINALLGNNGIQNIAIGGSALDANTIGTNNVAMGIDALGANTTGINNIAIGSNALSSNTTGSGNIAIGVNVNVSSASASNQIVIGTGITPSGDNTITVGNASANVYAVLGASGSWIFPSDRRLKTDIKDDTLGLDFISSLRPVTYKWKASNEIDKEELPHLYSEVNKKDTSVVMHGLIAQEVKESMDKCGNTTFDGWSSNGGVQNLSREMFVIPLIKAVKELTQKVTVLEARVKQLESPNP